MYMFVKFGWTRTIENIVRYIFEWVFAVFTLDSDKIFELHKLGFMVLKYCDWYEARKTSIMHCPHIPLQDRLLKGAAPHVGYATQELTRFSSLLDQLKDFLTEHIGNSYQIKNDWDQKVLVWKDQFNAAKYEGLPVSFEISETRYQNKTIHFGVDFCIGVPNSGHRNYVGEPLPYRIESCYTNISALHHAISGIKYGQFKLLV